MSLNTLKRALTSLFKITREDLGKSPQLDFIVTSDFYRVDIGLIICRRPVFWTIEELEVKKIEKEYNMMMKYDLYPYVNADLMDFERSYLTEEPKGSEEDFTHYKKLPNNEITYYRENSKFFKNAHHQIFNNKSIQHASCYNVFLLVKKNGKWCFPSTVLSARDSLNFAKDNYMEHIGQGTWEAYLPSKYPCAVFRTALPEKELADNQFYQKCVGRKIFYFEAYHDKGVLRKLPKEFEDYAWVSKPEMNKFLDKEQFDFFMKYLKLTN